MAITGFKPVLGSLTLGTGGFSLPGDNSSFCEAILRKTAGSQPARLESLTYILPGQEQESGGGGTQSPVVVNLLMQLRASCDQNNVFLRTGQMSQTQIMAQLRQTLARSDRAVRAQAGEIERAVRKSLFEESEFRQALDRLEREVKKNGGRPEQAAALTRAGQETTVSKPELAAKAASLSASSGGWRIRAQNGGYGCAVQPLSPQMGARDRTQLWAEGQTTLRNRTQGGEAGWTISQTVQWPAQGLRKGQPERLNTADGREPARRGLTLVRMAEVFPGEKKAPLIGLRPREAEQPEGAAHSRKLMPGRLPDASASEEAASKRAGRRAGTRSEAEGTVKKPLQGAPAGRNAAAGGAKQSVEPLPSAPGNPEHRLKAEAGVRVEAVWIGGAERTEQFPGPFARYLFRAGLQMGIFPAFQAKGFPVSLRLDSGWRAAKDFLGLFSRAPGTGRKVWPGGMHAAQGRPTLRWRQMTSELGGAVLPGVWPVWESAAPLSRKDVFPVTDLARRALVQGDGDRRVLRTARSLAMRNPGLTEAGSGAFGFGQAAESSRRAASQLAQPAWRTVPADISITVLPHGGRDRERSVPLEKPELTRLWTRAKKPPAAVFKASAASKILVRSVWVPSGTAAFGFSDLPASAHWTELVFAPAGPGGSDPKTAFQSMPQRGQAHQTSTHMPGEVTSARLLHEPDSRLEPDAGFRQNGRRDLLPTLRSAAALTQRGAPAWGRLEKPVRWESVENAVSARFVPRILRRILIWAGEGVSQPQSGLPRDARMPQRGQNAPPRYAAGKTPVEIFLYSAWPGSAPAGSGRAQAAAGGLGGWSSWAPAVAGRQEAGLGPVRIGLEGPATGKGLVTAWPGTALTGSGRAQAAAGRPGGWNSWAPAVAGRQEAGLGPIRTGLKGPATGKGLVTVWPGSALTGSGRAQAAAGRPGGWSSWVPAVAGRQEAGLGPVRTGLEGPATGKSLVTAWPGSALTVNGRAQATAGRPGGWSSRVPAVAGRQEAGLGPVLTGLEGPATGKGLVTAWPGSAPAGSGRAQAAAGRPGGWSSWAPAVAGRQEAGLGPVRIGLEGSATGKGLVTAWQGTALTGSGRAQASAGRPGGWSSWAPAVAGRQEAGLGPVRTGLEGPATGKGLVTAWPGSAPAGSGRAQAAAGRPKAGSGPAGIGLEGWPAQPGLTHFVQPLEPLEDTLSDAPSGGGKDVLRRGGPAMIFRSPARAAAQDTVPREKDGEAVLAAQTVSPEQAQAMNRAFSYAGPLSAGDSSATPGALLEQQFQSVGQGEQEVNYNRLTEEIMVRIERRLRAERRKFGL